MNDKKVPSQKVKKFKPCTIDLRGQLPHIGQLMDDGRVRIIDRFYSERPNYEVFKKKKYNSADACASILLGILCPNILYRLLSKAKDKNGFTLINYDETVLKLSGIMGDIKEMMVVSNMAEDLPASILPEWIGDESKNGLIEYANPYGDDELFPKGVFFETISFLRIAEQNGYPIPDELKIHEINGQWEYVDAVLYGDLEQTFPAHPTGKPKEKDPLYVAMLARTALVNKEISNPHNFGARDLLNDWIKTNFSKISARQRTHIISIVNDGFGTGKSKI